MSDWYSRIREEDGRTDDEVIADTRRAAEDTLDEARHEQSGGCSPLT
jgi:hypothetical protein